LADLLIVDQNPLKNLKVLYGTGALRLNDDTGKLEWVGGIRYTVKEGVVYDAKKLLADVAGREAETVASHDECGTLTSPKLQNPTSKVFHSTAPGVCAKRSRVPRVRIPRPSP
jgi:hypothetical protein